MIDYDSDWTRIICCSLLMYMACCNNSNSDRDQLIWWTILGGLNPWLSCFVSWCYKKSFEAVCSIGYVITVWVMWFFWKTWIFNFILKKLKQTSGLILSWNHGFTYWGFFIIGTFTGFCTDSQNHQSATPASFVSSHNNIGWTFTCSFTNQLTF